MLMLLPDHRSVKARGLACRSHRCQAPGENKQRPAPFYIPQVTIEYLTTSTLYDMESTKKRGSKPNNYPKLYYAISCSFKGIYYRIGKEAGAGQIVIAEIGKFQNVLRFRVEGNAIQLIKEEILDDDKKLRAIRKGDVTVTEELKAAISQHVRNYFA